MGQPPAAPRGFAPRGGRRPPQPVRRTGVPRAGLAPCRSLLEAENRFALRESQRQKRKAKRRRIMTYAEFAKMQIDLGVLGAEGGRNAVRYICTPKGANIVV